MRQDNIFKSKENKGLENETYGMLKWWGNDFYFGLATSVRLAFQTWAIPAASTRVANTEELHSLTTDEHHFPWLFRLHLKVNKGVNGSDFWVLLSSEWQTKNNFFTWEDLHFIKIESLRPGWFIIELSCQGRLCRCLQSNSIKIR